MSLNKLFSSELSQFNSLIVSATEDCDAIMSYIEDLLIKQLGVRFKRKTCFVDRFFDLQDVNDIISSTSLFGDANLIVLRFKTKPSIEQAKKLIVIFEHLNEDNKILLFCDKLDKKDQSAEWLNSGIKHSGMLISISGDLKEARLWADHILANNNLSMDKNALDLLLNYNQNNLTQLYQELNKFCLLYQSGYSISYNDAVEQLTDNAQFNVFALSSAYLNGNLTLALKIFNNVCQEVEDTILVVWNLSEDLRKLIQIKNALRSSNNFTNAISGLRIWGDSINAFQIANERISYQLLLSSYDDLAVIDKIVKGLESGDVFAKLQQVIFNLCQGG